MTNLIQIFPDNEVQKGQLTMQLKKLREKQEKITWPSDSNDLPVVSWESCESVFSWLYRDMGKRVISPGTVLETPFDRYCGFHS